MQLCKQCTELQYGASVGGEGKQWEANYNAVHVVWSLLVCILDILEILH